MRKKKKLLYMYIKECGSAQNKASILIYFAKFVRIRLVFLYFTGERFLQQYYFVHRHCINMVRQLACNVTVDKYSNDFAVIYNQFEWICSSRELRKQCYSHIT